MGSLGWPEMVFIFVLALVLFGPKKLPELGRTLGKAITEFRRASNELKATFDREMKNLEQETELKDLKQIANDYKYDSYNYDYSSYEGGSYEGTYGESHDSTATTSSTASASAPEGAESSTGAAPESQSATVHPTEPSVSHAPHDSAAQNGHTEHAPATPEHQV
jgi:TatA/E family protein of Tat protein translocase